MSRTILFLLGLACSAIASPVFDRSLSKSSPVRIGRTVFPIVPNTVDLTRHLSQASAEYLGSPSHQYGQSALYAPGFGQTFTTKISVGGKDFQVLIDTGSSDTWLIQKGFTCLNQTTGHSLPEQDCHFGSHGFVPGKSFTRIPNENFNISYAGGEYLNGFMGYDTVTVAGITVKQEIALATQVAASGDGTTSGLLGLAYPALTSAYSGTNASADTIDLTGHPAPHSNRLEYSSIIHSIFFVENKTEPLFSMALSRDRSKTGYGGTFAIGGIPDPKKSTINVTSEATVASTPIETLSVQKIDPKHRENQFYSITVEGLVYSKPGLDGLSVNVDPTQYIVDSGSFFNFVPTEDATAFNALFEPPAQNVSGNFLVQCNATVPEFGVAIGTEGDVFYHNAHDLIFDAGIGGGVCISGIQDNGPTAPYVLGDVFLKNVLAVYNVGSRTMEFSSRMYYKS